MKIAQLSRIKTFFFNSRQLAKAFGISEASARVTCHRYARQGFIFRLKRDLYVRRDEWNHVDETKIYQVANRLQIPSYISLTTALSHYEITTQIQQEFVESVAVIRTKEFEVSAKSFHFTKIKKILYFGFVQKNGFFIATPEKAFLDAVYLESVHRYKLDRTALTLNKLDWSTLDRLSRKFPKPTRQKLEEYASARPT